MGGCPCSHGLDLWRAGQPLCSACCSSLASTVVHGPARFSTKPAPSGATRLPSRPPTRTISTTWTAASRSPRDEIKGRNMWIVWTGGNDRFWDAMTSQHLRHLRSAEDRCRRIRRLKYSRDNRWNYLGLVNEPCFEGRPARTRTASACGSTCGDPDCPPDPFADDDEIPRRRRSARAARRSRSARTTAIRPASSGCGCFPTRISTRPRRSAGTPSAIYNDPDLLQRRRTWSGRIASACRAASATSARTRSIRRRTRKPAMGEPELDVGAQYFWVDRIFAVERATRRTSSSSSFTPRGPARSTPRWSRPTTSTIRAR